MAEGGELHFKAGVEYKEFLDDVRKMRDAVVDNAKAMEAAFEKQETAIVDMVSELDEVAEAMERARKAGDTKTVEEQSKRYDELTDQLEAAKKEFIDLQKEFGRSGGMGSNLENPKMRLRQMRTELEQLTIQYRAMTAEEQNSAKGQALAEKIRKLTLETANLRDTIGDVNASTKSLASDTAGWDALGQGINVATSAMGGLTGAAALLGAEEEDLQDIQTKLQASLAISNALSVIQNNLQKESSLMLGIRALQEKALTAGITLRSAAEGKGVIATTAATVAQRAFNLVAKANPYVLLATAIISVVGAFAAFSAGAKKAKKEEEELAAEAERTAEKIKATREAFVSASAEAMNNASIISNLQVAYQKANTELEKTEILKQAAEHFKKLGFECNGVTDAQRLLVEQGGAVIEMLQLQGEVAALSALRMEAFKKSYQTAIENGGPVNYASWVAGGNSEVRELDQLILSKSTRISSLKSSLPMRRSGGSGRTTTSKAGNTSTGSGMSQEEVARRIRDIRTKQQMEQERAAKDMEFSTREAEIKALEEGTDKTIAQINLDKDRELEAIDRAYEDLRQKRIDDAKALWDADPGNKDKDFFKSEAYARAASEEAYTNEQREDAAKKRNAVWEEWARQIEAIQRQETDAMNNYLKAYGTYQEQRLAIESEYDQNIADARTEGEKLMLGKQKEAELQGVDERFGLVTQAMADLFADASKKSVKAIQAIIDKYEKLVKYMEGHKGTASKDDLAELGFSDTDIQRILRGEVSIKDLTDRLKDLKGELKQKSPYQSFIGNMKDAIEQLKKAKTKEDKANAFGQIASSIKDALPALKEFGSDLANIFGKDDSKLSSAIDGLDGMMTAGQGVAQIMSGHIVEGAMSAVKGISQMVDALDGLFGADYSSYENMVEQYDRLIDVWDTLIDRKQEYIDMSYGPEAAKAGQEAIDIIEKQTEAYRNLGREWLNAGASAGSHSQGVRQRNKMSDADWQNVAKALGRSTDNYAGLGGRLEGLFELSASQLEDLQEQAPEFWAKLNDETQKYLQGIIDGEQKIEDIQKQVNEQLTSTTFDSLKDSFANALYDMESTAEEGGENIGEALFKSIVDNFIP